MLKTYYDPSNPGSFSSIANLARASSVPYEDAKNWLLSQDTYTLHRVARKKFPRNRFFVSNIDDLWQADLCDMRSLSKFNDGFNYILTCIDVLSKFAFVVPLKTKHNTSLIEAFQRIFSSGRKCLNLQSDKGGEFVGKKMMNFLKNNKVNFYPTRNPDVKAAVVERFNRTLKNRMWRYLTYKNSFRYIDVLDKLVDAYNKSFHRSIKMRPIDVSDENILQVWKTLYRKPTLKVKPKFKIDTHVRIARKKSMFEKGYETYFSEEIFKISKIIRRPNPVYELKDMNGEIIDGLFYEHELQPVAIDEEKMYKIDKILAHRKRKGIHEVLVAWYGYPQTFNSWIPYSDLFQLQ